MTPEDIAIHVAATDGKPQRVVIAVDGDGTELHRAQLDTNSDVSRRRFFSALAQKTEIATDDLVGALDNRVVEMADQADEQADAEAAAVACGLGEGKRGPSQATALVNLTADAELWHTPDGDGCATVHVGDHQEHLLIRSNPFRHWLVRQFYQQHKSAPTSQARQDAICVLESRALYDGDEHPVYIRLAGHDGKVYLDLCNAAWQAVEIDADGWRIVDQPPVRFRRAKAMLSLPAPIPDGNVDALREFLNVPDEVWPLILAWAVAALRPEGPYPVLNLAGEQGTAKSTAARLLRACIDPNSAPVRAEPREPRDLAIVAGNGWVISLDNLSYVRPWLSDGICRLSTGGGFSTRTLYQDAEETIFHSQRPAIINGIEELATRGDLLDRCLIISLPRIPEDRRRSEANLWREFERARPAIIGALLNGVSAAIKNLPDIKLKTLPRMADFAIWMTAAEPAIGLTSGTFMAAYSGNREEANSLALEASPVAKLVLELPEVWEGTAGDLLNELEETATDGTKRLQSWPKTPRSLSGALKRLAPNLRATGVDIEFWRQSGLGKATAKRARMITITKVGHSATPSSPTVPPSGKHKGGSDLGGTQGGRKDTEGDAQGTEAAIQEPLEGTKGDEGDDGLQASSVCQEQGEWTA